MQQSALHSFNQQKKKEIPRDSQCIKYYYAFIFFKFFLQKNTCLTNTLLWLDNDKTDIGQRTHVKFHF